MGFAADYMEGLAMRQNPALLKRKLASMDARAMKDTIAELYGQAATPEQTAPYQMGEDEMFPGEAPVAGLMDITQEAAPGSGLLGGAQSPTEERYLQAQKVLGMSGQGEGLRQQGARLADMQNAAMQGTNAMDRQLQEQRAKLLNPQLGRAESEIEFFQRDPSRHAAWQSQKKVPSTEVNVASKMRSLDDEILLGDKRAAAKNRRNYISGITAAGRDARQETIKTDRMLELLDQGVNTGFGEDWILTAKQAGKNLFGLDTDTMGAEELQVLMGDLVMKRVAETKGAISEKEMDLFRQYSANFGKSPEGNRAILNFYKAMLDRSKTMTAMIRKMQRAGDSSYDIEEKILKYQDENPLQIGQARKSIDEMSLQEKKARLAELRGTTR